MIQAFTMLPLRHATRRCHAIIRRLLIDVLPLRYAAAAMT